MILILPTHVENHKYLLFVSESHYALPSSSLTLNVGRSFRTPMGQRLHNQIYGKTTVWAQRQRMIKKKVELGASGEGREGSRSQSTRTSKKQQYAKKPRSDHNQCFLDMRYR